MKNSQTSFGWLSLRFWAISFGFWVSYALLTVSATLVHYDSLQSATAWENGFLRALPVCFYWLGTPPLFELAHRWGNAGLSAGQYYLRLFLAVFVASTVASYLFSLNAGMVNGGVLFGMMQPIARAVTWGFQFSAIMGVAVAITQFRTSQVRHQELLAAQLRALRSQLQPHFLFNSLQAIAVTIKRDGAAAASMVTLLGDLLRQTLRERNGELVSLQEEQELLQPYLELQRLRFADRLEVEIDMPNEVLGASVPDLILQPLVENALQHGIEAMPGKGSVRIRARRNGEFLELEVADDGAGPDHQEVTDGIGLGATRARLQALFGDRAQLTLLPGGISGAVVTVRMPWQEVSGVS
jgi:two-component system, LytTR family, sensor kinase